MWAFAGETGIRQSATLQTYVDLCGVEVKGKHRLYPNAPSSWRPARSQDKDNHSRHKQFYFIIQNKTGKTINIVSFLFTNIAQPVMASQTSCKHAHKTFWWLKINRWYRVETFRMHIYLPVLPVLPVRLEVCHPSGIFSLFGKRTSDHRQGKQKKGAWQWSFDK